MRTWHTHIYICTFLTHINTRTHRHRETDSHLCDMWWKPTRVLRAVSMFVYAYMNIFVYAYIGMFVCAQTGIFVYTYTNMFVFAYMYVEISFMCMLHIVLCLCMHLSRYKSVWELKAIFSCIYTPIHTCMHTYIGNQPYIFGNHRHLVVFRNHHTRTHAYIHT
jgi:hypothetical protein